MILKRKVKLLCGPVPDGIEQFYGFKEGQTYDFIEAEMSDQFVQYQYKIPTGGYYTISSTLKNQLFTEVEK